MSERCSGCGGPMNPAPEPTPAVKVTFTVTVEMTEAQRDAYSEFYGVGFVGPEIAGRIRPDVSDAFREVRWMRQFATVTISKPQLSEG